MNKIIKDKNLKANIDFDDHILTINGDNKNFILYPQFRDVNGFYTSELTEGASYFVGWRPYEMKSWHAATNKELFKILLEDHQIRTPAFTTRSSDDLKGVIIKPKTSSFGNGIKGPIKSSLEYTLNSDSGEYFEQYIAGHIVKIWFWNHIAYAAETKPQPYIIGNGTSTIGELIHSHARMINQTINLEYYINFLAYKGLLLNTVLNKGEVCTVDFRYKSLLPTSANTSDIKIENNDFYGNHDLLKKIGFLVKTESPPDFSQEILYSIDGILDYEQKLWVLEINSNPVVHPYLYKPMLETLLS